jgi:3-mercaptopyruvate sulfurtransferase SseA
MGFTNVSVLDGGVQAWIEAGLPVTKNGSGN